MSAIALLFVGAVLAVNGLVLLGRVEARGAAPINLFVGALFAAVVLYNVVPARDVAIDANADVVLAGAGSMLFAFTYLYVGVNNLTGHDGTALGWYCGWAALVSAFLAVVNFVRFDDARFGALWVLWAVLFASFFVLLAFKRDDLQRLVGVITVTESVVTGTVPGALVLLGAWDEVPGTIVLAAGLLVLAGFGALAASGRGRTATAVRVGAVEGARP